MPKRFVKSYNGNWNAINPNAEFPRLYDESKNADSNNRIQTRYLANAAYVRLKNITFGYTLPKTWVSKISLTDVKLIFSAENIYTWSSYLGVDPEVAAGNSVFDQGIDIGLLPPTRSFSLGVKINL